jgi:RNA polymerase sigma factor (sigma-70 family)
MAPTQLNTVLQHLRRTVLAPEEGGMSDGQLLESFIARRDEAAFEALVRRHGPMVLGVCRRLLRHVQDAEDAFQATFLVLVRKAASIMPREMVANWLYGVAFYAARKAQTAAARRGARERQVVDMPEPAVVAPDELGQDLQPLLDRELSRLPDKYRVPIVLCDLEGKSHREAALQVGCPQGTLSARLSRGRALLAKRLSRYGLALTGGALAAALGQAAAPAAVPMALLVSTVKAGTLTAAGQSVAAGLVSAKVAALTKGVLQTMLLTKLKIAMAVLLAVGLIAGVVTGTAYHTMGPAEAAGAPRGSVPDPVKEKVEPKEKPVVVEKDGVAFELVVPERTWVIPDNKPGQKTHIKLGLRITNKTDKPQRFNGYDALFPEMTGRGGKALRREGGEVLRSRPPREADFPLVLPGQSVTFDLDAALVWEQGSPRFVVSGRHGGRWYFDGLHADRYLVRIHYENNEHEYAVIQDQGKKVLTGLWTGSVETSFVEVSVRERDQGGQSGRTERPADDFGAEVKGLRARVSLAKQKFVAGEAIPVSYVVKNVSKEKQIVWHGGFWPNHRIVVSDADGKEPALTPLGRQRLQAFAPGGPREKNAPIEVPAGGEDAADEKYDLTQHYDLVKPGRYRVQFIYEEKQGGWEGRLPSNEAAFQVVAREEIKADEPGERPGHADEPAGKGVVLAASKAVQVDDIEFQAVVEPRRPGPAAPGGQQAIDFGLRITNPTKKPFLFDLNTVGPILESADGKAFELACGARETLFAAPMLLEPGTGQTVLWRALIQWPQGAQTLRLGYIDGTSFAGHFDGLRPGKYRLRFRYETTRESAERLSKAIGNTPKGLSIWIGKATTEAVAFEIVPGPKDMGAAAPRSIDVLIAELESADGATRLAATRDLFARGKAVLPALEKAGARPIAPVGTIQPRRLDVIYSLLKGLPSNPPMARAGYRTDSFGLHFDLLGAQQDAARLGALFGFSLTGTWGKFSRPNCYVNLDKGKSLAEVMHAVLTSEPRVITVSLNYFEE